MNTGFNYGRMGLAGNAGLAQIENSRRWNKYEFDTQNDEAQNEAIGNLAGMTTGAGLEAYRQYKKPEGDTDLPETLKRNGVVPYRSPTRAGINILDSVRTTSEEGYTALKNVISPFTNYLTGWTR
jgi:hypothetical protein